MVDLTDSRHREHISVSAVRAAGGMESAARRSLRESSSCEGLGIAMMRYTQTEVDLVKEIRVPYR